MTEHTIHKRTSFFKYVGLALGALLMALSLGMFFVPFGLIDGGITGISLMLNHVFTNVPLGILLAVLNAPFVYFGYKQIGKSFAIKTTYGLIIMAIFTEVFHNLEAPTTDPFLATICGGLTLGIGVGIAVKLGGALDGTEVVAIQVAKKIPFSVGEIILFINVFIFTAASFVFGVESALYSVIAYYVASKMIDTVTSGFSEMKRFEIISEKAVDISEEAYARLGRGTTFLKGRTGFESKDVDVAVIVVTRLEISKLKEIIHSNDANAFVMVTALEDIKGGGMKKDIH